MDKTVQELEQEAQGLEEAAAEKSLETAETAKVEETKAEEDLEKKTVERLEKTFVTHEKLDEPPEPSEKSDDSTPEKDEKPAEEVDDKEGPTAAEKKEEAELEAETKEKEEEKEADDKVKDEDVSKGKDKEKETPRLSDAYVRAAIHEGWTEEDIKAQYKVNPELTIKTLGNIYEAVNRLSKNYSAIGRAEKERIAAKVVPEKKEEAEKKSEFKGLDIDKLRKQYPDEPLIDLVETQQAQTKALFDEAQEVKAIRSAPATGQPSDLSPVQIRAASSFFSGTTFAAIRSFSARPIAE